MKETWGRKREKIDRRKFKKNRFVTKFGIKSRRKGNRNKTDGWKKH